MSRFVCGLSQNKPQWLLGAFTLSCIKLVGIKMGVQMAKNRGLVTIPEVGDQVMVDFELNNPERPFITGSVHHGKVGGGGGDGNNIKSLTSKSGHTVQLNDGGGITIRDKSKLNHIEVNGNNMITVTAAENITLTNGHSSIVISKGMITIYASEGLNIQAPLIKMGNIGEKAPTTKLEILAQEMNIKSKTSTVITSPKTTVTGTDSILINSTTKANIEGGPAVNIIATKVKMN